MELDLGNTGAFLRTDCTGTTSLTIQAWTGGLWIENLGSTVKETASGHGLHGFDQQKEDKSKNSGRAIILTPKL